MRRIAALLFALVLLTGLPAFAGDDTAATHDFAVKGMTCGMCEKAITKSVRNIEGVREVRVDTAAERVTIITAAGVDSSALITAIEAAGGYKAKPIASDS